MLPMKKQRSEPAEEKQEQLFQTEKMEAIEKLAGIIAHDSPLLVVVYGAATVRVAEPHGAARKRVGNTTPHRADPQPTLRRPLAQDEHAFAG